MAEDLIKADGFYNGHSAKGNFDIELKLRFLENQAMQALQFISSVGYKLRLIAKYEDESIKLGTWNFYSERVDKDANVYLSLRANRDYVFVNNLAKLMEEHEFTFVGKVIVDE